MSDLTTRLRALGIEPGEAVCGYELRAQESSLIPRLSSDAALDWLVGKLEEGHAESVRLREWKRAIDSIPAFAMVGPRQLSDCVDAMEDLIRDADDRAEQAEAERDRLRWMLVQACKDPFPAGDAEWLVMWNDLEARYEREVK